MISDKIRLFKDNFAFWEAFLSSEDDFQPIHDQESLSWPPKTSLLTNVSLPDDDLVVFDLHGSSN